MAGLYEYEFVKDEWYVQAVRESPPSKLLPLVAEAGARAVQEPMGLAGQLGQWQEWVLADIARVSLAQSNENRAGTPTMERLWKIHNMFQMHGNPRSADPSLETHLLRLFSQQLDGQADGHQAQARSAGILLDSTTVKPLEVLGNPDWEQELFGCSLVEYIAATRLIRACALIWDGRVDPALLTRPEDEKMLTHIGRATFETVLARHFVTDVAAFKRAEQAARARVPDPELRRFAFNPLRARPLISGYGSGYLCPSPHLAWAKSTPQGLYFTGLDRHGLAFTRDMGHLFEAYVGRHLRLLPDIELHSEITYCPKGRDQLNSVDWIVEFPDLLLLVEVKATMPTEAVRLGDLENAQAAWEKVGTASGQIEAVANYIRDGHPAYSHIHPAGRPILGLAITLEPFYLINAYNHLPETTTPVYVASAEELERLVTITSTTVSQLLLGHHDRPERGWHLRESFTGHSFEANPIVEQAWNRYPWS